MKRTVLYLITIIVLALITLRLSGKYILKWIDEKEYTFNSELPNSKIYVHNSLDLNFYELNSIKSLIELSINQVDSIFPNHSSKVEVYLSTGNNSATTVPEYNKITMYNSNDCYAPFCHEYIHAVLGVHKELWFSEGVATYLGQEIRSRSKSLLKYCDGDERYLIEERSLSSGVLKTNPIITNKYSKKAIKELLLGTKSFQQLTIENKLDYYFFAASFCKYLFDTIGEAEMIELILKIRDSHNSISKEFKERKFEMDEIMNAWLIEHK